MRLGLRQKLVVLVLVILVPLLALLAFNLYRLFTHLEQEQLSIHVHDARVIAASLDEFVHDLAQISRTSGIAVAENGLSPQEAERYLRAVREHVPVSNVAYLDTNGRVLASALATFTGSDLAAEPAFREVVSGAEVGVTGLRRNASGNLGFAVFTPVRQRGRLVAVSQVAIDARDLGQVVPASVTHGAIVLTDENGALVFSNRPELSALSEQQRRDWDGPLVRDVLAGREVSTRRLVIPRLPGVWLGATVPARVSGWTVGLFDPSGAALAQVSSETYLNLAVVVVVVGLSLLAARAYGRSITEPIERLTAVTNEIERGRFDAEVPVTTRDEIGELAENFAQMQASLKRTLGDVQVLAESARWMSSTLDLEAIAHAADDYLERILGARAVAISLFEEGKRGSVRVLAPGLSPEAAEALTAAGAGTADSPGFQRRGYAVVPFDPHGALAVAAPRAHTLVVLALVVNRRLIGRIDALAAVSAPLREFAQADVPLAAGIAQQVASAAENARLFEQQRLIADTLQDSLLTEPYRIPELDIGLVYHQATIGGRIGGDFYDFIPVERGRTAIVIGDITGKGLEAARFTTIAKGALHAFALEDADPASVLGRTSRVIAEQLGVENFVTAVYTLFDLSGGQLTYALAGHPPPMLLRSSTGKVEPLTGGGVPLGVEAALGYEDHSVVMGPCDRLLLYTDGLSEARRGKELFGIERIAEVFAGFRRVPVRDVAAGIAEAAIAFAGGELDDDLAIIVIERREPAEAAERTSPS